MTTMTTKQMPQILIVDDNQNNLFTLRSLLTEHISAEVIEADSGEKALNIILQQVIDLIILDVQMPGMDGFETARILGSIKKTKNIPIVFLTAAYKSEEFQEKGFAVGAADYLTKPIDPSQLINRIRTYLHFIEREYLHTDELLQANNKLRLEVNERKQAQAALALLSRQKQLILDSTEDGIFGMTLEGAVSFLNPAAAKILGYAPQELIGQLQHEKIHYAHPDGSVYLPEDCPICNIVCENRDTESQRIDNEVFWRKDGTPVPVEYIAAPLIENNKTVGGVVSFSDISLRKEAEASMQLTKEAAEQAREAAEQANLSKSQFLANMSHELRTPLNAIIGYSEILTEEFTDQLEDYPDFNDYIDDTNKILESSKHLLTLINDVLDISKIESGKATLHNESISLITLLDNLATTVQPLVVQNHNTFQLKYAKDLGYLFTDLTKLRQILLNLISNACKFTEKGHITLTVVRQTTSQEEWLDFSVTDTGIGIPLKEQEKLFEPFTQADGSATRKYGGTGLGLTLSKHFAEIMGGRITIQSEVNKGSTFTLHLKAASAE